ncbi:MAG: LarC family nickel insertion protein [Gammaproteobacteria bacterium]
MHLHLDAVGGIAGDMFVAALLDLRPDLAAGAIAAARAAGLGTDVALVHEPCDDGVLTGSRFVVALGGQAASGAASHSAGQAPVHTHAHGHGHQHEHAPDAMDGGHDAPSNSDGHSHSRDWPRLVRSEEPAGYAVDAGHASAPGADHDHPHAHDHVQWSALRARLAAAPIAPGARERAIAIFAGLADAEARVHGKSVDAVSFHEVGAWDSIADIVAAAWLIEEIGAVSWSVGPLPLGSGRVRTAHGLLPVPAPATVLLLEGLPCFDDGHPGERITPTGAAILHHLAPAAGLGPVARVLGRVGHGFGTRRLRGLPNVLRVLTFEDATVDATLGIDHVTTLAFEVDDQTPEDLALGLERLRAVPGVIDVVQGTVTAKQGRQAAAIRVLTTPAAGEAVAAACFRETTTLGVRLQCVERRVLSRESATTTDGTRIKRARRPGATTAKAELADLATAGDHAAREARRRAAEGSAFDDVDGETTA